MNPLKCESFICKDFSEACNIMDVLEQRYPGALLTAVDGRVLSVAIVPERALLDLPSNTIEQCVRSAYAAVQSKL